MTLSKRIRKQRMKCFLNCRWATCIRLYRPNYRSHGNRWLWRHTCVTFKPRVLYKVDYYYKSIIIIIIIIIISGGH